MSRKGPGVESDASVHRRMARPRLSRLQGAHPAVLIYAIVTAVFLATTSRATLSGHTPYNHFALLAEAWIHGRLDLGGPPPAYTGGNDFALFDGRTYVSFPPFPAVLIAPIVALTGSAERVADGRFFLWCAGIGPAVLYLVLDKLTALGRSRRNPRENIAIALLFAFGTVYWFSAVQGTVWFAAHVVGVALAAVYLYASIDAAHPVTAGLALALGFATRTPLGFAFPLFLAEAARVATSPTRGSLALRDVDRRARALSLAITLARFAAPIALVLATLALHNRARFSDALEFGHRFLAIGWRGRIDRWGLFSYHYLGRNLAVVLTSLPYTQVAGAPFQINAHGLALWVTSPFLAWAFWPSPLLLRGRRHIYCALLATTLAVAAPSLLYQNSGWIQFGYRFSNDFAVFLVAMIAVGHRKLGPMFWSLGALAVIVNGFGAVSFQREGFDRFYFLERTQRVLHQPD
jgi:hypothetical protein